MRRIGRLVIIALLLLIHLSLTAQVAINTASASPHVSAMLDVTSNNRGLLIPRIALTSASNAAPVTTPATGLLIYNTATAGAGVNAVTPGFYYWGGSAWIKLLAADGSSSGWSLQGNAGTDSSTNFIGTTDAADLVFKVNGKKVGLLEDTADTHRGNIAFGIGSMALSQGGYGNIALGTNTLAISTTGSNNIAIGYGSMSRNQAGSQNIGVGINTLLFNEGGIDNIAMGLAALARNTNGFRNLAFGTFSLNKNTTGQRNIAIGNLTLSNSTTASAQIAIGDSALFTNTTGSRNIAIGTKALLKNTTGIQNLGIGYAALYNNQLASQLIAIGDSSGYAVTTGFGGTFIGYRSGRNTEDGYRNTFVGFEAGLQNISGYDNVFVGNAAGTKNSSSQNTFIGSGSGFSNTLGNNNTFVGNAAATANATGYNNTVVGALAGFTNSDGFNNTFIGMYAATANTTGASNTIIGAYANVGSANLTNATAIGSSAYVTQSNSLILGSIAAENGAISDTKVGIGTPAPAAMLQVASNGNTGIYGVQVTGSFNSASIAPDVIGSNMFFHPGRGVFRAGYVDANQWNGINVGAYSSALGHDVIARGASSFAANEFTQANGTAAAAFGSSTKANGPATFAANSGTRADADASSAFGYASVTKGFASTVVGIYNDSILAVTDVNYSSNTPLFIVGNGSNPSARSNAMVVLGSGTVQVENLRVGAGTVISKQQAGTLAAGTSATQLKQFTINFPTPFAVIPKIIVTPRSPGGINATDVYAVSVTNISTTGATVNVFRVDFAGGWGQNLQLDWFAWE
jgi:hypothetical protein